MDSAGGGHDAGKADLRRMMRAVRADIAADAADRAARSATLWLDLVATVEERGLPDRALRLMLFESLPTEPDTSAWFAAAARRHWTTYVPEVDGTELRVMPGDIDPAGLDVVVFPGLAFTPDGRRLGQGGGHYDRFATRLSESCLRIAVCFREQVLPDLPTQAHDERVHVVIAA